MEEAGWGSDAEWFRPFAYLGVIQHEPLAVLPWLFAGGALVFGYPDLARKCAYYAAAWRFIADWILPDAHANGLQLIGYWIVKVYWCAFSGLFFSALFIGGFFYGIIAAVLLASIFTPIFVSWKRKDDE